MKPTHESTSQGSRAVWEESKVRQLGRSNPQRESKYPKLQVFYAICGGFDKAAFGREPERNEKLRNFRVFRILKASKCSQKKTREAAFICSTLARITSRLSTNQTPIR